MISKRNTDVNVHEKLDVNAPTHFWQAGADLTPYVNHLDNSHEMSYFP